ncbi:exodeoxyribonuclease III [Terriglobus roseus DSM 18391]|uniref:Exodeoxyribonuclease III n=1 Tax=Terriglobus roseus (strain DSM 18391 / NRRL B-41598 / KBS 63) TaxID=926566 RepID=I3ZLP3_TERRK|nr:exodeoxyribonuclease III [Terriglobus roseus DSM 18391]
MVIATWNVNSIRARMTHALAFLEARRPDVLLMQELKGLEFPAEDFRAVGYESVAIGQKSYNGVAILSRLPIEMVTNRLAGDDEDTHARYLETIIDTPTKLRVVNIYLPNGNPIGTEKFFYKLQWMDRLIQQMLVWKNDPIPTIIGGDFNVIPEEIDCDKPANWVRDALFQPEPRERYRAMKAMGFVDAFRTLYPDTADAFTYWDYFRQAFERNRGIRIDHFLLSPALAPRLTACEIDKTPRAQEKPSDHTPLLVTLA